MDDKDRQVECEDGRGMARHYKLGLLVLGALLIALVVVAVVKLSGGRDEKVVASESSALDAESGARSPNRGESTMVWQSNKPSLEEPSKPTPVPPKPVSKEPKRSRKSNSWSASPPAKSPRPSSSDSDSAEVGLIPNLGGDAGGTATVIPPPPTTTASESERRRGVSRHPDGPRTVDGRESGSSDRPSPWGTGPPAFGSPSSINVTHAPTSPGEAAAGDTNQNGYRMNPPSGHVPDGRLQARGGLDSRLGPPEAPRPNQDVYVQGGGGYQRADHAPKMGSPRQSYDHANQNEPSQYGGYDSFREPSRHARRSPDFTRDASARRDDGKYVVQPNDSFWTISERLYGNGAYFRALAEWNRETVADQNRLNVGEAIATPPPSELEKRYPDLCPSLKRSQVMRERMSPVSNNRRSHGGPIYTVREGDTLYDIARYKLGTGARWTEIYDLNRDVLQGDFDYLTPGMRLALPDDSPDAVTRRPGSSPRW